MNIKLQSFYLDEPMREEVKTFMISLLEAETVQRVFSGKNVVGILEAKELVDKSFSKLEELYKPKKNVVPDTNE
jgi:hypothetical protein